MGLIAQQTITELNNRIDAIAVVSDYVKLEKKSGRLWGCCPFHREKTPSFTIDPDRKTYYCFGCHEGGGIIKFVMEMDKLSFPEAVETLAKRFGVAVAREDGANAKPDADAVKKDDLVSLYQRAAGSFSFILTGTPEGKRALEYVRSRGISDAGIARFRLGYAPADPFWLHRFLRGKGYSEGFLAESGLFTKANPKRALFAGRLIFPIADRQGRIAAFGGRILEGDGPKYLNSAESLIYKKRDTLFALDLALKDIRETKAAIVAEGYMDVIALHEAGVRNAVAPLGTAFTAEQARLLARWADRVRLLFDADAAGQAAAVKAILTCRSAAVPCEVIGFGGTAYKDPADILKDEGAGYLQNFVKNSIFDFEYLLAGSKRTLEGADSRGKARAAASLFPFLDLIDSEIEREAYFRMVAETFETGVQSVLNDYKVWQAGKFTRQDSEAPLQLKKLSMNDELYLLGAVAVNCGENASLFAKLRSNLSIDEFDDPYARELYITLEECVRSDNMNLEALLSGIETEELRQFVVEKAATGEFSERAGDIVDDSIKNIKRERLERKRRGLVAQMYVARNDGLSAEDLMHEKMFIDTELQNL